jgi:hypothetical protein
MYRSQQQRRILAEVERPPDRKADQTATWSLSTLQRALRKTDLPDIAKETIRQVLHEYGYSYQRTRTWCRTGYALRKRKSGTVTVYDPDTPEKKDGLSWRANTPRRQGSCNSMKMKPAPTKRSRSQGPPGKRKSTRQSSRTSTSVAEQPNC